METTKVIAALSALAQETRLEVFRLLMKEGPGGLSAGVIARKLMVPPATLSFHLSQLEKAGLLRSHRQSRRILYAADIEGTRRLLSFMLDDCCQGNPEICGDLARDAIAACETANILMDKRD